jgi:hypothetical protein
MFRGIETGDKWRLQRFTVAGPHPVMSAASRIWGPAAKGGNLTGSGAWATPNRELPRTVHGPNMTPQPRSPAENLKYPPHKADKKGAATHGNRIVRALLA